MSNVSKLFEQTNNPANIRFSQSNDWLGQVGSVKGFCKFVDRIFGLRALFILLRNDLNAGKSVQQIITEFAPPSENDTDSYIKFIEDELFSVVYDDIRPFTIEFNLLVQSMCVFETGYRPSFIELQYIYERFFK